MSDSPPKINPLNQLLLIVLTICSGLISVIFWGIKSDLSDIKHDTDAIKIDVQKLKDKGDNHADAINKLDREYDYLLKVKVDKKKTDD